MRRLKLLWLIGLACVAGLPAHALLHGTIRGTTVAILTPTSWSGTDCSATTCAPPAVDTSVQNQQTITNAANNGSGLIRLTVGSTTYMASNDMFTVASVGGVTAANGDWLITVIDSTHVDLQGSTFSGSYTSGGTIGFIETAIAAFDEYPYAVVETAGSEIITVGAAIANRGWISKVRFYLGGTTLDVNSQTKAPNGDIGWAVDVRSSDTQNGDLTLIADVYPVNGKVKRISLPLWLNSSVSGTGYVNRLDSSHLRYVNPSTGSDSNTGVCQSSCSGNTGPWLTLGKAATAVPNGGVVSMAAGTYTEDANLTAQSNARMIDFRAVSGGVTITRTTRLTSPNNIWSTRAKRVTYDGVTAGGITIDLSKIVQIKGGAADCILIFKNAALTDPNGVAGPAFGYSSSIANDFLQSPFLGDGGGASTASVLGIVDSTMTTYTTANPRFMRNVTISYAADAVALTNGTANSNTWWWGVTATKTGDFKARASDTNTVTVASKSGTGPTTLTLSSSPVLVSSAPQYVTFQSGALNGQTFAVSSASNVAKTITTTADTSAATAGDTLFFYTLTHADAFQFVGNNTSAAVPPDNVYFQRYKNTRSDTSFLLQPFLGQTGSVTGGGANTLTTSGTAYTTSSAWTFVPGDFISITGGAQQYEYQRVVSVTNTTTGVLEQPFSANQSALTTWSQAKSGTNIALINVIIDGASGELFQPQHGQLHYVIAQSTLAAPTGETGPRFQFRNAGIFGIEGFAVFDSLFNGGTANTTTQSSMGADTAPGFPTYGYSIDNNAFAWGSQGTNSATGVVTLNSSWKPTAGLSLTMRGVRGGIVPDGTPLVPWDINGAATGIGMLVGAVSP